MQSGYRGGSLFYIVGGEALQEEEKEKDTKSCLQSVVSFFLVMPPYYISKLAKKKNKINIKKNWPIKKLSMYINIYIQNKRTILNFLSALGRI